MNEIGIGVCQKCGAYTVEADLCDDCSELIRATGSLLDFSILPRHIERVCKVNGFPLSLEQMALISGSLTAVQTQIQEAGLEQTIYAFAPSNDSIAENVKAQPPATGSERENHTNH